MNTINKNYPVEKDNNFLSITTFKAAQNGKIVTEISDDIFKLASAAITATGIATLGIKAKNNSEEENVEIPPQELVNRAEVGRRLGIDIHSVNWHIEKGRLIMNEDNLIDVNNEHNKRFIEEFQKGKRKNKSETLYSQDRYPNLQVILGKYLPIEYCLQNGLLTAEDDGRIDIQKEPNKTFVEKIKKNELSYKTFFQSQDVFAKETLGVNQNTVKRAVRRGDIVLDKNGRIDINNEKNKAFINRVKQAQEDAKIKRHKRVKTFTKDKNTDSNLLTREKLAEKLGYKNIQSLYYHVRNGRLVFENGYCDISKEPNKSFVESKLNGTLITSPVVWRNGDKVNSNPNCLSKAEFARRCTISCGTLTYHIAKNNIVVNSDGKIDITDEKNKFFMENHKKGVPLYPAMQPEPKQPKEEEPKIKNPNVITIVDLTNVTGLAPTTLGFHVTKGRLIRTDGGIDVTNPINKLFIDSYEETQLEKLNKMNSNDLLLLKQKLQDRYKSFIPKSLYIQAQEAKNKSDEDFNIYIKDITYTLFRVEILSTNELNYLEKTVKNIINERLEDNSKPNDFSDIKDFQLTGVIELEHELNIIDKLIEYDNKTFDNTYKKSDKLNASKLNINNFNDLSKFLKKDFPKSLINKIKAWILTHKKAEQIEFEQMSQEELKQKMMELFFNNEKISDNQTLCEACDFIHSYNFETDEQKKILVDFIKELYRFSEDKSENAEFSKDILNPILELSKQQKELEDKKQEKFEKLREKLDSAINMLYTKGLSNAALICYKYMPENADETEKINQAKYIIRLVNKLNTNHLPVNADKGDYNKQAQIRAQKIEDIIVGYDAKFSNSPLYRNGVEFSLKRYGRKYDSHIGEYIRHYNNLNNANLSSYPEFCQKKLYDLYDLNCDDAVIILSKLEEWSKLPDKEQKHFRKMYNLFSKNIEFERDILNDYIDNYYTKCDTIVKAVGNKDKKLQVDATFAKRGKKELCDKVKKAQWIDYFEEFESAMTYFAGKKGRTGIKDYYVEGGTAHEVKTTYPGRLFCYKTDLVFDGFDYDKDD